MYTTFPTNICLENHQKPPPKSITCPESRSPCKLNGGRVVKSGYIEYCDTPLCGTWEKENKCATMHCLNIGENDPEKPKCIGTADQGCINDQDILVTAGTTEICQLPACTELTIDEVCSGQCQTIDGELIEQKCLNGGDGGDGGDMDIPYFVDEKNEQTIIKETFVIQSGAGGNGGVLFKKGTQEVDQNPKTASPGKQGYLMKMHGYVNTEVIKGKGGTRVSMVKTVVHFIRVVGTNSLKAAINLIKNWSGKRDSNSRPQPWQGCALPTELFPHTPK